MSKKDRLRKIFHPQKVIWCGGQSMEPGIRYMKNCGFEGEAAVLNPKRSAIGDLETYTRVENLPWIPDLAILVLPKEFVAQSVHDLSSIGCGAAILITSGFSEVEEGEQRQSSLIDAAGDMPVIGPNCPGIGCFRHSNVFMMNHFGNHAHDQGIAVISNGGAYLSDLGCADRSQEIAYLIGLGNQAMVNIADMLDLVLDDPAVKAVNIYFEGVSDIKKLSQAAAKAARQKVPVVAIKGGRSKAGTRAARSHTASLAGDEKIASALFERFGWIEVRTPSEAIETLKMLTLTSLPRGFKTGFVTSSGSYAVLGGDLAENAGLLMEEPAEASKAAIKQVLPPYVGPANPLDTADAHGWDFEEQIKIYEAFAQNDFDVFVQVMCYPPEGGWDMSTWDNTIKALAYATKNSPAAFVNTLAEALPREARKRMSGFGIAPLQGMEDGLKAVAHACSYGERLEFINPATMILENQEIILSTFSAKPLDETKAKLALSEAGLDTPISWTVQTKDELPTQQGFFALKAIVPGLLHKSEAGAVILNIKSSELEAAYLSMQQELEKQGYRAQAYLVEEMITDPLGELLVGIRRIDGFGLVLTLAAGGVTAELLNDSKTIILPASRTTIHQALLSLKLAPLFQGYRGRALPNMDVALDAIGKLAAMMEQKPSWHEAEINPLLLTHSRAVVADALIILDTKRQEV